MGHCGFCGTDGSLKLFEEEEISVSIREIQHGLLAVLLLSLRFIIEPLVCNYELLRMFIRMILRASCFICSKCLKLVSFLLTVMTMLGRLGWSVGGGGVERLTTVYGPQV